MSFEQFLKLCQDWKYLGVDVAEATKRWDRIFKKYNDGKFEAEDMWAEEVSDDIVREMKLTCEARICDLVEEFEDAEPAEPEAPKEAPKVSQTENKKFDKFTAEDEPEDFFAGKTSPANTEFVLPA